ncbi:2-dehydropantoate 2-reductase [Chytriomyces confervae]|uniref:2-dehydropantoate 2-reductase n=1 Tax=Chytriomyces confervae TaxID=246404 RepID=A0A507FP40_9FUNG|nr:hypothetical protein HDU80_008455 [Chytriomyces hyalinus]TPX78042.1 2-dehydropantoate 2-reductase [Chytriomyces confervae]
MHLTNNANVLIIGGGACGAYHGHLLSQAGQPVAMVCRSNFNAVQKDGFQIAIGEGEASVVFRPSRVFRSTSEAANAGIAFEHVLLFTKATAGSDTAALVAPLLSKLNIKSVSLWHNGIGVEDSLARVLAANESIHSVALVSAVVYAGISRRHETLIRTAGMQKSVAGLVDYLSLQPNHQMKQASADQSRSQQMLHFNELHTLLSSAFSFTPIPHIQSARWQKSLWNASIGLVSLVGCCADVQTVVRTQQPLVRALMKEIVDAASCVLGTPLVEDEDATFEDLLTIPLDDSFKPDIVLDWESGRELDHQVQYGNLILAAKAAGASVPRLEALYSVLQLMVFQRHCQTAGNISK